MRQKKVRKKSKLFKIILIAIGLAVASTLLSIGYFYIRSLEFLSNNPIAVQGTLVVAPTLDDYKAALTEKGIAYEQIAFLDDESGVKFQIEKGPEVYFSASKDVAYQISSLQGILTHSTIDNKKPKRIDFRFAKPVVNF